MFDNLGYVGEIQQKIKELEVSIKALRKTGSEFAMAEREYKKQLAKTALELRDKKMAVDYTSTLNLPKTEFSMRANLPQREPEIAVRLRIP